MPRIDKILKNTIKFKMGMKNLTQTVIASQLGYSQQHFSQMINGVHIMPEEKFQELLDILDMRETFKKLRRFKNRKRERAHDQKGSTA